MRTDARRQRRRSQVFWWAEAAAFALAALANGYLATTTTAPWAWGLGALLALAAIGSAWFAHSSRPSAPRRTPWHESTSEHPH
jgi:hypothetical protein